MSNYEVEFKFEINKDLWSKLVPLLPDNPIPTVFEETDIYYENKGNNKLAPEDKALRIRRSLGPMGKNPREEKAELTFKGPKISEKSKTRQEINLKIGNMKNFDLILKQIGFKPEMKVKKLRTVVKFTLPQTEIKLNLTYDIVENLGSFIEIETFTDKINEISVIEEKILAYWNFLLETLNIKEEKPRKSIRESYLELLSKNKAAIN